MGGPVGGGMWCGSGASSGVVQEARKSALVSLSYQKRRRNKAVRRGREPGEEGGLGGGDHICFPPPTTAQLQRESLLREVGAA